MYYKDYTNQKFNKLLAVSFVRRENNKTFWKFLCDCGNYKILNITKVSRNNSTTKSCGCLKQQIWQKVVAVNKKRKKTTLDKESTIKEYYSKYKSAAKKRKYDFELPYNIFKNLIFSNCHYCNSKPFRKQEFTKFHTPIICNGVDRKDNKKGYTIDNCVPCCIICNKGKSSFSYEYYKNWIANIKKQNL